MFLKHSRVAEWVLVLASAPMETNTNMKVEAMEINKSVLDHAAFKHWLLCKSAVFAKLFTWPKDYI
jgi:hypothetical protein